MKKQLAALAYRRQELLEKIEAQRMEVAEISERWQKPLAVIDVGMKAVRFIHNHPALVGGGVAVFLAWRRKGLVGLAQEGWRLLCLYPSILALGLESLSLVIRSSRDERINDADH